VKILSCGEQSVSSDEEENISYNSGMQHDIWAETGAERPHFPFTSKHGINVDFEGPSNPLEYFELFCTPETVEVTARETNRCAQNLLENLPNLNYDPEPSLEGDEQKWNNEVARILSVTRTSTETG
jgi:hypothetical protein